MIHLLYRHVSTLRFYLNRKILNQNHFYMRNNYNRKFFWSSSKSSRPDEYFQLNKKKVSIMILSHIKNILIEYHIGTINEPPNIYFSSVFTFSYIHIYFYLYLYVSISIYMYICMCVCAYIYIPISVHLRIYIYIYIYICLWPWEPHKYFTVLQNVIGYSSHGENISCNISLYV